MSIIFFMVYSQSDIQQNRITAAIGYFGMLCFIPLLLNRKSPYAQFHAYQGLVLFLLETVLFMIFLVPVVGMMIWAVLMVGFAVVSVVAYWRALKGEAWEIPIIIQIVNIMNNEEYRDSMKN